MQLFFLIQFQFTQGCCGLGRLRHSRAILFTISYPSKMSSYTNENTYVVYPSRMKDKQPNGVTL